MCSNSSNNLSVNIHIEPADEYQIQEISYDGQEKYIPPLSMAESFSQLIAKIDFNEDGDEPSTSSQVIASAQRTLWPFESVKSKLRDSLTEICVLHDILKIANHKVKVKEPGKEERDERKYIDFDIVTQEPTPEQNRTQFMMLIAKKKAFQVAAQMLISGADNLRTPLVDKVYSELLDMRQNWRLRRNGNVIMGDLSFRTIGSRYTGAKFEVTKNDRLGSQALKVKVPADLDGYSQIHVAIHKDNQIIADVPFIKDVPSSTTWQEKLEQAQNVLFCKELFAQLAKDAVQSQYYMPVTVTGNQIVVALFPDTKLSITLLHKDSTQHKREKQSRAGLTNDETTYEAKHIPMLEQSLHQMLRDFHVNALRKFQCRDTPKHAGCEAYDRQTMADEPKQESLLRQIKLHAQHMITRQQTMDVIDSFAQEIKDPMIVSHWFCLNSPIYSSVRVNIVSQNYENLGRTPLVIRVGPTTVRVINRDGKTINLSYEPEELRNLLLSQTCLHQINTAIQLSKLLGWVTLALNYNVGVCKLNEPTSVASLVLSSPSGDQLVSIKSGPLFGLTVSVASNSDCPIEPDFHEVDWEQMEGRSFLSKLELLIAALCN